jgi:polar amino acid transport system ATP-binding protein
MSNADSSTAAVAITGLRKSYGSNEVLKGIDLQVQPGEVIAIIGKSGSGTVSYTHLRAHETN